MIRKRLWSGILGIFLMTAVFMKPLDVRAEDHPPDRPCETVTVLQEDTAVAEKTDTDAAVEPIKAEPTGPPEEQPTDEPIGTPADKAETESETPIETEIEKAEDTAESVLELPIEEFETDPTFTESTAETSAEDAETETDAAAMPPAESTSEALPEETVSETVPTESEADTDSVADTDTASSEPSIPVIPPVAKEAPSQAINFSQDVVTSKEAPSSGADYHLNTPLENQNTETQTAAKATSAALFVIRQIKKVPAINRDYGYICLQSAMSDEAAAVGILARGGVCYILEQEDREWFFVESGEVRGFARINDLVIGDEAVAYGASHETKKMTEAVPLMTAAANEAFFQTRTTVMEEADFLKICRRVLMERALQCLGNPYVWGGTDLSDGCDCSGFVQSLYAGLGVSLPRVSREQSLVGEAVELSAVEVGDLIFYETDGLVTHVLMAVGDGLAVNAANSREGIVISEIDESRLAGIRRIMAVDKNDAGYSSEELALIWAIVAQEDDTSYEGALAVISCTANRAAINYGGHGLTALEQLTADGQFCYSPSISDPALWQRRLNGNVPDYVKMAVSDCLTQDIRNHEYLNFRSTNRTGFYTPIGGNWYF